MKIFYWVVALFIWFFVFLQLKGVRFQAVTSSVIWDFVTATAMVPIVIVLLGFMGIAFSRAFKSSGQDRTRGDYYDGDGSGGGG